MVVADRDRPVRSFVIAAIVVAACSAREDASSQVVDLGGGDAARAWQIVFVGDGYRADELPEFRERVAGYVAALRAHDAGFVAMAPEAFHFWRVDVSGDGWYLGTWLDRTDSCERPWIYAESALVRDAAARAPVTADVIVMVAHDVDGRANAGAITHVSDRDPWQVVEHELSHVLFHLGDEYSEFMWCSERAPRSEADVLATPNVTLLDDPAKWASASDAIASGGGRWPCAYHPTSSCTMLDPLAGHYCSVCEAAVRETIAARMCDDDGRVPRVAFVGAPPSVVNVTRSGQTLAVEAAAFDESDITGFRFLVDDAIAAQSSLPWAELAVDTWAPGPHTIAIEAVDGEQHVGTSARYALDIVDAVRLAPSVGQLTANADADGWVQTSLRASPPGGLVSFAFDGRTKTVSIDGPPAADGTVPIEMWLPARAAGTSALEVTAFTARGASSSAVRVDVTTIEPTAALPAIEAVRVNGTDLASFAVVAPKLDIDVSVRSCAPLARVAVAAPDGTPIGAVSVEPIHSCVYVVRVTTSPVAGTLSITATDRYGRKGTSTVAVAAVQDVAAWGFAPSRDGDIVALARPASIAFGQPSAIISSGTVAVDGTPAPAFPMTRPDGARGALLAATDLPGPLRDGEPVDLRVTVVGWHDGLVATTAEVPVLVDAIAPRLRVSRYTREGEPLTVDATDGGGDVDVEVTGDLIRAVDHAGNVTERTVTPIVFPHDRAGCPR
jgi:hypothetical protein